MHLFYQPDFTPDNNFLSNDEAQHCVKVLRHRTGDLIVVTDGKGTKYQTKILSTHSKACELEILEKFKVKPLPYAIHLAIAPTKNTDRMEWMVEKCVEIGIDQISFITCQHSDRKKMRMDRIEKKAIAAMKQAQLAYLPSINQLVNCKEFINKSQADQKFIAHYHTDYSTLKKAINANQAYLIMVGPEGDFSQDELDLAIQHQFTPVTLGNNRLRTETAGLMACHTFHVSHH